MKMLSLASLATLVVITLVACTRTSVDQKTLKEQLVATEKQSWEAWKNRDGKFFEHFLSDDHVEVGYTGVARKADVVAIVASPVCQVRSYSLDQFEMKLLNRETALLTYRESQETICNGHTIPSPCWVSSLYIKNGDQWRNAVYQQTAIIKR